MSRERINKSINAILSPGGADDLRKLVGTRAYTHSIKVNASKLAKNYKTAIGKVNGTPYQAMVKPHNNISNWQRTINKVILGMAFKGAVGSSFGKLVRKPRQLDPNRFRVRQISTNIYWFDLDAAIPRTGQSHIEDVLRYFRQIVYGTWLEENGILEAAKIAHKQKTTYKSKKGGGVAKDTREEVIERIGKATEFAHDEASTTGTAGIAKIIEDEFRFTPRYPGMEYDWVATDLIEEIFELLSITWKEEPFLDAKTGALMQKRVVRGELKADQLSERTDKKELRKNPGIKKILAVINKNLKEAEYLDEDKAADFKASPSFRQQAAQAAQYALLRQLMQKNKRHIAVKKVKTKPVKPKKRSGIAKHSKRRRPKLLKGSVLGKNPPILAGAETGKGRQASTDQARELAQLQNYINSRLPAEVRRNMGRPALINRTGIFSNSARLVSLRQAANTIVAKYTYMLTGGGTSKNREGVYETFENTGKRDWPLGYNPKPLIAKSIRNLAKGRIEQKLTLRRV